MILLTQLHTHTLLTTVILLHLQAEGPNQRG